MQQFDIGLRIKDEGLIDVFSREKCSGRSNWTVDIINQESKVCDLL